jgi:hypothetical protein
MSLQSALVLSLGNPEPSFLDSSTIKVHVAIQERHSVR